MYNEVLVFAGNFNSFLLVRLNHVAFLSEFSDFKNSLFVQYGSKFSNCAGIMQRQYTLQDKPMTFT
jgi:hypothetical protein